MTIQQKVKIKKKDNLESKFLGVKRLFALIYSNYDHNSKRYKTKMYYLPKCIINNYNRQNICDI